MSNKLVLLVASLAMVLASTAALAQTESGGSVSEDELLCLLPEGCDTNGDGTPELRAGEPVIDEGMGTGVVQYEDAAEHRSVPYQARNVPALSAQIHTLFAPGGEVLPAKAVGMQPSRRRERKYRCQLLLRRTRMSILRDRVRRGGQVYSDTVALPCR